MTGLPICSRVSASERELTAAAVNGTYRNGASEIKILSVGQGKLCVQLALVYKYRSPAGPSANVGDTLGDATIENDVAVLVPEDAGEGDCKITMTFLRGGKLKVVQEGGDCGFGHNVRADGIYKKVSNRKPKFEPQ